MIDFKKTLQAVKPSSVGAFFNKPEVKKILANGTNAANNAAKKKGQELLVKKAALENSFMTNLITSGGNFGTAMTKTMTTPLEDWQITPYGEQPKPNPNGIFSPTGPVIPQIKPALKRGDEWIKSNVEPYVDFGYWAGTNLMSLGQEAGTNIGNATRSLGESLLGAGSSLMETAKPVTDTLGKTFEPAGKYIAEATNPIRAKLDEGWKALNAFAESQKLTDTKVQAMDKEPLWSRGLKQMYDPAYMVFNQAKKYAGDRALTSIQDMKATMDKAATSEVVEAAKFIGGTFDLIERPFRKIAGPWYWAGITTLGDIASGRPDALSPERLGRAKVVGERFSGGSMDFAPNLLMNALAPYRGQLPNLDIIHDLEQSETGFREEQLKKYPELKAIDEANILGVPILSIFDTVTSYASGLGEAKLADSFFRLGLRFDNPVWTGLGHIFGASSAQVYPSAVGLFAIQRGLLGPEITKGIEVAMEKDPDARQAFQVGSGIAVLGGVMKVGGMALGKLIPQIKDGSILDQVETMYKNLKKLNVDPSLKAQMMADFKTNFGVVLKEFIPTSGDAKINFLEYGPQAQLKVGDLQALGKQLEKLPQDIKDQFAGINMSLFFQTMKDSNTAGYWNAKLNELGLNTDTLRTKLEAGKMDEIEAGHVLFHEIGHKLEQGVKADPELGPEWKKITSETKFSGEKGIGAPANVPFSRYQYTTPGELFAESFRKFSKAPDVLKAESPKLYDFMEKVNTKIAEGLSVPFKAMDDAMYKQRDEGINEILKLDEDAKRFDEIANKPIPEPEKYDVPEELQGLADEANKYGKMEDFVAANKELNNSIKQFGFEDLNDFYKKATVNEPPRINYHSVPQDMKPLAETVKKFNTMDEFFKADKDGKLRAEFEKLNDQYGKKVVTKSNWGEEDSIVIKPYHDIREFFEKIKEPEGGPGAEMMPRLKSIPPELEPLAKEARKYKSAEEFVKKGTEYFYKGMGRTGFDLAKKSGFIEPQFSRYPGEELSHYFTKDLNAAKEYSVTVPTDGKPGLTVRTRLPKALFEADPEGEIGAVRTFQKLPIENFEILENGKWIPLGSKSYLTDLYNQATGKEFMPKKVPKLLEGLAEEANMSTKTEFVKSNDMIAETIKDYGYKDLEDFYKQVTEGEAEFMGRMYVGKSKKIKIPKKYLDLAEGAKPQALQELKTETDPELRRLLEAVAKRTPEQQAKLLYDEAIARGDEIPYTKEGLEDRWWELEKQKNMRQIQLNQDGKLTGKKLEKDEVWKNANKIQQEIARKQDELFMAENNIQPQYTPKKSLVFHGGGEEYDKFDMGKLMSKGAALYDEGNPSLAYGKGMYFAESLAEAKAYGTKVLAGELPPDIKLKDAMAKIPDDEIKEVFTDLEGKVKKARSSHIQFSIEGYKEWLKGSLPTMTNLKQFLTDNTYSGSNPQVTGDARNAIGEVFQSQAKKQGYDGIAYFSEAAMESDLTKVSSPRYIVVFDPHKVVNTATGAEFMPRMKQTIKVGAEQPPLPFMPEDSGGLFDGEARAFYDYLNSLPPVVRGGIVPPQLNFKDWDAKKALTLVRETFERNIESMAPKGDADKLKEFIVDPIRKNTVDQTKFTNELRAEATKYIKNELRIRVGSTDDKLIMAYGEGRASYDQVKQEVGVKRADNIVKAADWYKQKYDMLLTQVNKSRMKFGFEPIPRHADYFRHFQEIGNILEMFGQEKLPTEIAGLTMFFRPGKPFSTAELPRLGGKFTESAIKGFDNYLDTVPKQIFQIDSIQRVRALEAYLRQDQAHSYDFGPLATNLREYGDQLAGKKSMMDRSFEALFGRDIYGAMNALRGKVSANMIGANISSALTNYIPLTQALATTGKMPMLKGITESLLAPIKGDYTKIGDVESSFLVRRFPIHYSDISGLDSVKATANWLFEAVDKFTAKSIVAGKYFEGLSKGVDAPAAMKAADDYAGRVMADRSFGQLPVLMGVKTTGFLTQFQTEVNNMYSFVKKDIPMMSGGSALKATSMFSQLAIYSYLFNNVFEQVVGRRPTLDPIHAGLTMAGLTPSSQDAEWWQKLLLGGGEIAENLPFIGGITGGRIPMGAAMPDLGGLAAGTTTLAKEAMKPASLLVLPFGGFQMKKTYEGLNAYTKGYSETNTGRVRFPIDQDFTNALRAILFGQYAFPEAREYYDEKRTALGESQSAALKASANPLSYYESLIETREKKKKAKSKHP